MGTIYNPVSKGPAVTFDECVYFGRAFQDDKSPQIIEKEELSFVDAAACPESLELSNEAYYSIFKNKFAVWMYPDVNGKSCVDDFFYGIEPMYNNMFQAGAKGVLFIDTNAKSTPGVWYREYQDNIFDGLENSELLKQEPRIPIIHCGLLDGTEEQVNQFNEFKLKFYDMETNQQSYPDGLSINVSISENRFAKMFENPGYAFFYQYLLGFLYFYAFLLAIHRLAERLIATRHVHRWNFFHMFHVPTSALLLEAISMFALGLFYAVDGLLVVPNSAFHRLRPLFWGQLVSFGLSTSVFVGLNFYDFRRSTSKFSKLDSSFVRRHRKLLIGLGALFALLDLVGFVLRQTSLAFVMNAILVFSAFIVAFWFLYESIQFSRMLRNFSKSAGSSRESIAELLNGTIKWTRIASIVLLVETTCGLFMVFPPHLLWNPAPWSILWFLQLYSRGIFSIAKINLLRLPNTKRSRNSSTSSTSEQTNILSKTTSTMSKATIGRRFTTTSVSSAKMPGTESEL